jgi:hypothetical protein
MQEFVIVALALAAVVVFTDVLLFLIAHLGSWARLAEQYPAHYPPEGRVYYFESAQVGWLGYNNGLILRLASEGLYVAMPPLLNFGHRPMLIPWSAMQIEERKGWTGHWAVATLGDPPIGTLTFRWAIAEEARRLGYLPAATNPLR